MKASEVIRARVPAELKLAFESLAANHGLSASHVLRQIIILVFRIAESKIARSFLNGRNTHNYMLKD